ncbi:MAG TPA: aldolase/citrate lyase family protein [Bryobacterales bacterium]|nr:aldolase/citrate lyase family protein [Bryobacterales bacterium]
MRPNRTKQLLHEGKTAFGCGFGQFRSPEIPRLFAAAGFDWTFIDTEHGCFDLETIQDVVRTSLLTTLTPIVRVADLQYSLVARALDMGAEGVIFPRVESPELLERAVSWTKFPTRGVRGFGLGAPQAGYKNASFQEIIDHQNENNLVVLQVETRTALARADELLSVPGIDIVMVGPADLSISLGVPGQFDHPKMIEAISGVIECCRRHGIHPGIQCRTLAMAKGWKQRGMRFVGCGNDIGFLWEKARETVQQFNAE